MILKAHLNKSLSRNEYNIAVFQLKKKLVFSEVSIYRPVCLPPKCDHVCRTRNGKTQKDLQGNENTLINSFGSLHSLKIISNGKCQKMINKVANPLPQNNPITKIKRLNYTSTTVFWKYLSRGRVQKKVFLGGLVNCKLLNFLH